MTKPVESLTAEDKLRAAIQDSRPHLPRARGLSILLPGDAGGGKNGINPRFPMDSALSRKRRRRPAPSMRVLLRHAKTLKYFRSADQWTDNPRQARDFRNGWWATVQAFTMNPRRLVIHYQFKDDRYNLNIPVLGHPEKESR